MLISSGNEAKYYKAHLLKLCNNLIRKTSMFPHWDLTWLLGCPFCLSFTFLWRLKAWLQLEMGHTDCLKVSSHTKPSLRITCTWLNSLPGAGAGRNCFPSSAEWRIVPFPAWSVSFYLGNSLTLPDPNTSLLFPCGMSLLQWRKHNTEALAFFSIYE